MPALVSDLRSALRSLARRPAFATLAIATLALGIAASTAIFSVVHAILIEPLPFTRPHELVTFATKSPNGFYISLSIPNYRDWRDRNRSFQSFAAWASWGFVLTGRGPADVLSATAVMGEYFETLEATTLLGRTFTAQETEPGAEPVVVLDYGYWASALGGDPAVIGRALVLDDRPHTIVGVLKPGFLDPSLETQIYVPMGSIPDLPFDDRGSSFGTEAIARLAPGVPVESAREDMARVWREVGEAEGVPVAEPEVRTFSEYYVGQARTPLRVLMAGVLFVLLIAIVNVANLQLARGEDRRREMAVRTALGAGRGALIRQLLIESLVLALLGGVMGIALSWLGVRSLVPLLPDELPSVLVQRIDIDPAVVLFGVLLAVASGGVFGVVPALRTSQVNPATEIKLTDRGTTGRRGMLRQALVVSEVSLALLLLIGAGLMLQSFDRLRSVEKGFDATNVLTARLALPDRYGDEQAWLQLNTELLTRAQALPGVRSAALALLIPLASRSWERNLVVEGIERAPNEQISVLFNVVSPEYFATMRVPLIDGRPFQAADRVGSPPVAVIDETMAARFWPGESALGKRIHLGELTPGSAPEDSRRIFRTVVGVAKNVRHYELANPSRVQAYIPQGQAYDLWGLGMTVLLRTAGDATAMAPALRRELDAMDPDIVSRQVRTLESLVARELSDSRAMGTLFTVFGAAALTLSAIGIFGVMSYLVARRTREISVRMALGADARDVVVSIARGGLVMGAAGVLVGLVAAVVLTRLLAGLLYGVRPIDPLTYGALSVFLLGVATLASYLPARRATRVSPVEVLRDDG